MSAVSHYFQFYTVYSGVVGASVTYVVSVSLD